MLPTKAVPELHPFLKQFIFQCFLTVPELHPIETIYFSIFDVFKAPSSFTAGLRPTAFDVYHCSSSCENELFRASQTRKKKIKFCGGPVGRPTKKW